MPDSLGFLIGGPMFYAKLIAVNLSISFLSAGCLLFFFHYPINLLLTHTLICFSAYLISFVFSLVLGGFPRIASLRIMPLLFSIFTTILMFVYLGNWVSNHFWKANLNFGLINRVVIHYYQRKRPLTRVIPSQQSSAHNGPP